MRIPASLAAEFPEAARFHELLEKEARYDFLLSVLRRCVEAVTSDGWFDDWWAGMDDAIYEDDRAKEAVILFRVELADILTAAREFTEEK